MLPAIRVSTPAAKVVASQRKSRQISISSSVSSYRLHLRPYGWLRLLTFHSLEKFFRIMGGTPCKRNQPSLLIAGNPAFVDVNDFVHRHDPYNLTRSVALTR